jgi:tRNA-dihydrouridine synthase
MGYDEVNLNLGCPSGTVVAKGKGAGLLADPEGLDCLLDGIFSGTDLNISLKTRVGMIDPGEFPRLLAIFSQYPVALLIIHPRVREDYYRRPVRMEEFAKALEEYRGPVCYNGGLVTAEGCHVFQRKFPSVERIMLGQGLLANPALARQTKGGAGPGREELHGFHDQLYQGYLTAFASGRNTVFHMKELWSYLSRLFEGGDKLFKQIRKAQDTAAYESAVEQIFRTLPLRQDAKW